MQRRPFLLGLVLAGAGSAPLASERDPAVQALRQGGCALLLRHARTEPGVGDPPGFRLGTCSTQRNLSDAGREDARAIGRWFAAAGLRPQAVRSSAWCRCIDTAQLAFGASVPWPPLDSTFDAPSSSAPATQSLREALAGIGPGRFEVWVTHQVNITALTGEVPAMGEGLVVGPQARVLARWQARAGG
jgi:phosphohistidine phosphatase SixA